MGCHPVGQGPAHGRILKPAPVRAKLPAGEPSRDHVGMVVGHDEATLGRGSRDRVRGMEHLAARRPRGGPETQGSEGAQPPASLRRGRTRSVWPHGVNWLSHKNVAEPALRTRAKLKSGAPSPAAVRDLSAHPRRSGHRGGPAGSGVRNPNGQVWCSYGPLLNRRRVIRGSIPAELSTFCEKAGATRMPRTLSAGTPLDSMFAM